MTTPSREGSRVRVAPPNSRRFASVLLSASLVRVVGWRQGHVADATRRAPSGVRQGGPWALKT
jgi:hypothetical protein